MLCNALVVLLVATSAVHVNADCIESFQHKGHPVKQVNSSTPLTWEDMYHLCRETYPWWVLLQSYDGLTAKDKSLCPGTEVPFGVYSHDSAYILMGGIIGKDSEAMPDALLAKMDKTKPAAGDDGTYDGVVDLAKGLWYTMPTEDTPYTCALCQMDGITNLTAHVLDQDMVHKYQDYYFYMVKVVGNAKLTKLVVPTAKEKADMAKAIAGLLKTSMVEAVVYREAKLQPTTGFIEITFHYPLERVDSSVLQLNLAKLKKVKILAGKYQATVEDVTDCPEETDKVKTGNATVWPKAKLGTIKVVTDKKTNLTTRRECTYNVTADRVRWSERTIWEMQTRKCSEYAQYANELAHQEYLGPEIALNQKNRLNKFAAAPIDTKAMAEVGSLVSREVVVTNDLPAQVDLDLVKIIANLLITAASKDFTLQKPQVIFVVADVLKVAKPVVGITLTYEEDSMGVPQEPIKLALSKKGAANVTKPLPTVSLTLSNNLIVVSKRIGIVGQWKHIENHDAYWESEHNETPQYLELDIILVPGAKGVDGINLGATSNFVDITYKPMDSSFDGMMTMTCVAWDDDASLWTVAGCTMLTSTVTERLTCRCVTKFFENRSGVLSGSFALRKEFTPEHKEYREYLDNYSDYY